MTPDQSLCAPKIEPAVKRVDSMLSKIRGRDPGQATDFTHPLAHLKTSSEYLVQFEGPTDPYQPFNWSFTKKTVTTILYGCITMGMLSFPDF